MMAELSEEASNLRTRLGFRQASWIRSVPVYLLVIGVFGVFLPWQRGRDFLDSVILGAYASLGVVFAAPAAAAEFETFPTMQQALARVVIAVLYGEVIAGALLASGITTVYLLHAHRIVVGPDLQSLAECLALGLTLSVAVSMAAVCVSVGFSARAAKGVVRIAFLGLLAAFYFRYGWLPIVALRGAGLAFLASLLLFVPLKMTLDSGAKKRE